MFRLNMTLHIEPKRDLEIEIFSPTQYISGLSLQELRGSNKKQNLNNIWVNLNAPLKHFQIL